MTTWGQDGSVCTKEESRTRWRQTALRGRRADGGGRVPAPGRLPRRSPRGAPPASYPGSEGRRESGRAATRRRPERASRRARPPRRRRRPPTPSLLRQRDARAGRRSRPPRTPRAQRAELVGQRCRGIEAMELEQLDPVEAQPPERRCHVISQRLGAGIVGPTSRLGGADDADLRGDEQIVGIRVERLGEQLLVRAPPVHVGGVDQGDAELDRPLRHGDRGGSRLGRCGRQPHGAEAQPPHLEIAADAERPGRHRPTSPARSA